MMLDVYVGDLESQRFKWEGGNWNGNTPTRISPLFPKGHTLYFALVDQIKSGVFDGKQVDWSGWVARLTPSEIVSFLDDFCTGEEAGNVREFLSQLDPHKKYALVASEL